MYILKCADRSYYVGSTTKLAQRLEQHEKGEFAAFTHSRRPFEVALVLEFPTIFESASAEKQVKHWSRAKKEALIRGDFEALKALAECRNVTHCIFLGSFGKRGSGKKGRS